MLGFLDYTPIVDIELGPLSISPHGMGIAIGFLLGTQLMLPHGRRMGFKEEHVYGFLFWAAIGAVVGARVAYVANHLGDYDNPLEWFEVWNGGISLLGGIGGAIIFAAPKVRSYGYSFWQVMDVAAGPLAVGIIVGRIGDLVVADHLGKSTEFFLGYLCDGANTASPCGNPGGAVHQPALYDLINLSFLAPALFALRKRARYDGFVIIVFGLWYGFGRFVEDFYRIDETHGTGLTGSQWTAVASMAVCLYVLLILRRTPWRSGKGPYESVPGHEPPAAIARAFTEPVEPVDFEGVDASDEVVVTEDVPTVDSPSSHD